MRGKGVDTAVTGSVYIYQEMLIEMFHPMVSVV